MARFILILYGADFKLKLEHVLLRRNYPSSIKVFAVLHRLGSQVETTGRGLSRTCRRSFACRRWSIRHASGSKSRGYSVLRGA